MAALHRSPPPPLRQDSAGLTLKALREHAVISFAKVAEYQRRGVVHFHAVIRLDGPDGPTTPPPAWATADALAQAVQHAAPRSPPPDRSNDSARAPSRWGTQLDIRRITMNGDLTEQAVAGYIAKYATKAAECVGTLDRRINPLDNLEAFNLRDHARRLIATCMRLGALPELADLRLAHWAHMLGFRGHFSTQIPPLLHHPRRNSAPPAKTTPATPRSPPAASPSSTRTPSSSSANGSTPDKGHSAGDQLLAAAITGTRLERSPHEL